MQIILASASRRRQDWLQKHLDSISDISVSTRALLTEESGLIVGKEVGEQTEATCLFKARAAVMEWIIISQSGEENPDYILVADTVVEDPDDSKVPLGKPINAASAAMMLLRLSDSRHRVWSSTAIIYPNDERGSERLHGGWSADIWTESALVEFEKLSEDDVVELIENRSWEGKAGAYDLAGPAGQFATLIKGEEITVLGFAPSAVKSLVQLLE